MTGHPLSRLLYNLGTGAYFLGIRLAAPFNPKARLMTEGRKETIERLREKRKPSDRYLWMHASSLGEFEQGRPVIEAVKKAHPGYKICLTFFSPSGYEVRKDYPLADIVVYLPFDGSKDLEAFVRLLSPEIVLFVKYEFWLGTLSLLRRMGIPTYLISAKFRPGQPFFKPWGVIFREALGAFKEIFVQEQGSADLLASIGVTNVTVAGDTRADRVIEIARNPARVPIVEKFASEAREKGLPVLVVGSSWDKDEERYLPFLKKHRDEMRVIIAPHEISGERLRNLEGTVPPLKSRLFSQGEAPVGTEVLVIDRIGLLSSIYAYADFAYIGGGFGAGIHNILEPAVYGLPVVFGPGHGKFAEAGALIKKGGAFSYETEEDLATILEKLLTDGDFRQRAGQASADFLRENSGATRLILSRIFG